jgi:hypothetical protein
MKKVYMNPCVCVCVWHLTDHEILSTMGISISFCSPALKVRALFCKGREACGDSMYDGVSKSFRTESITK